MKDEDRKGFLVLMAMLSEAFNENMSAERGKIYFEFLKKHSLANVTYAINKAIRELKFFPKVSEILGFIDIPGDYEYIGDMKLLESREKKENSEAIEYIKQMAKLIGNNPKNQIKQLPRGGTL